MAGRDEAERPGDTAGRHRAAPPAGQTQPRRGHPCQTERYCREEENGPGDEGRGMDVFVCQQMVCRTQIDVVHWK